MKMLMEHEINLYGYGKNDIPITKLYGYGENNIPITKLYGYGKKIYQTPSINCLNGI